LFTRVCNSVLDKRLVFVSSLFTLLCELLLKHIANTHIITVIHQLYIISSFVFAFTLCSYSICACTVCSPTSTCISSSGFIWVFSPCRINFVWAFPWSV